MVSTLPSLKALVNNLHPHTKGWLAEKLAFAYFLAQGFTPLRRPRRSPVQTDLLLKRGDLILLIEVKFRQAHASAATAISPKQAVRLRTEARRIAARNPHATLRADAVAVFPQWPFLAHTPARIALDGTR